MHFELLPFLLAQDSAPNGGGIFALIKMAVPFIAIGGIFYFMIIKPQKNQKKQHEEMSNRLKAGDQIVSVGGIHGTIQSVQKGTLTVKVDNNTKLEMSTGSVAKVKTEDDKAEDKAD